MNQLDHRERQDADRDRYRAVFTDDDIQALAQRNEQRVKAAQRALGKRWVGLPMSRSEARS